MDTIKKVYDLHSRNDYIIIIPGGALEVAERIRRTVEGTTIPCLNNDDSNYTKVTVSVGVNTIIPEHESTVEEFTDKVDKALYAAKNHGRNKVCEFGKHIK